RGDDGADVHCLVEWVAHPQLLHAETQLREQRLRDALLYQQARACTADLALIEPDGIYHTLDHGIEVGVVEHHEGRLAAQLQRETFAAAGGGTADDASNLRRASEGDLVYVGVAHQRLAHDTALAGDDIDDSGG